MVGIHTLISEKRVSGGEGGGRRGWGELVTFQRLWLEEEG